MSKVRINDLAKELEVKSRAILDVLPGIGVPPGKTHSSSLELDEAEKVRAHFAREAKRTTHAGSASGRHGAEPVVPKIDLSNISKPGDVMKALLAKKEEDSRQIRGPVKAPVAPPAKAAVAAAPAATAPVAATPTTTAPARPEPRKIVPQPRSAAPIIAPPPATPAIASRPPTGAVVAKAPAGAAAARPIIVVAPPPAGVVVKPPVAPAVREDKTAVKPAAAAVSPVAEAPAATTTAQAGSTPHAEAPTVGVPGAVPAIDAESAARTPKVIVPVPRRMVMPQTGPRPVYKASIVAPSAPATGTGLQRGKPIFDRRPAGGPTGPGQRFPGGPTAPPGS